MKVSLSLLILIVTSCQLSVVANSSSTSICSGKNPFLSILKSKGVVVEQSPIPEKTKCSNEWLSHGTCCEVNSLVQYAKEDAERINQAVSVVHTELKSIFHGLRKLFTRTLLLLKRLNSGKVILDKESTELLEIIRSPSIHSFRMMLYRWDHGNSQEVFASFPKCWNYMIKLRSNSLCFTCSGSSQKYFKDGKAIITQSTCSDIMDNCAESFSLTAKFIEGIDTFVDHIAKLSIKIPNLKVLEQDFGKMAKHMKRLDLHKLSVQMESSKKKSTLIKDEMCSKLVTLGGPTFIEQIADFFRNKKGLFKQIYPVLDSVFKGVTKVPIISTQTSTKVENTNKSRILSVVNWSPSSSGIPDLFKGDVTIFMHNEQSMSIDPSYLEMTPMEITESIFP